MTWHGEFRDPRLVAVYDIECAWARDDDLFVAIVDERPPATKRIVDLGCGTGRLTLALSAAGHSVTGIDPATASLDAARRKPGADRVRWVEGGAPDIPGDGFDAALMTSHVAQFVTGDGEWAETLAHVRRALVTGGTLCFDTRDPNATWRPAAVRLPGVDITTALTDTRPGYTTFVRHYRFADGTTAESEATMRFRSVQELTGSLAEAGLAVEAIYGGWDRQAVGEGDGELIVVATAGPPAPGVHPS